MVKIRKSTVLNETQKPSAEDVVETQKPIDMEAVEGRPLVGPTPKETAVIKRESIEVEEVPKTSTALATKGESQELGFLEGEESTDLQIPVVHLYQDTPTERKVFGEGFSAGDLVNVVTMEKVENPIFLVISGYKDWVLKDGDRPVSYRRKSDIEPDLLKWHGDEPPEAMERINFMVLFHGEDFPAILRFKKTSLKAGKQLNTLLRMHKGRVRYEYQCQEATNADGQDYLVPVMRPAGRAEAVYYEAACDMKRALSTQRVVEQDIDIDDEPSRASEAEHEEKPQTDPGLPF